MKPLTPKIIQYLIIGLFFSITSCVSIPKAAPDLSLELGKQVRSLEVNHKLFVQKFFDEKRKRVDEFIEEEWLPLFARNFFQDSMVWAVYVEITNLPDGEKQEELLNFILNTGPRLQEKLNTKRQEMIQPLDDLQQEIEDQLTLQYNEIQTLNNSLTNFLSSASKVEQNRETYLQALGIKQNTINGFIDKTDIAVNNLLGKANLVEGFTNTLTGSDGLDTKVSAFINTIKGLKGSLLAAPETAPLALPAN